MGTPKTKAQLDALYADNTSGDISAADLRDLVESMKMPWGELNFSGNAGVATALSSANWTEATFPTTTLNTSSHLVTKISGADNGIEYTGTPTILAYVFAHFQFSTEQDNVDARVALFKNGAQATSNVEFSLTPMLSGYAAAASTAATGYRQKTGTLTDATNASPIVITTAANHTLTTGDQITITGVNGNTAANGTFIIERTGATTAKLQGSTGNGAYTSAGSWSEEDALGPRPVRASHSGSVGQLISLATNDKVKIYVKNNDWTTTDREDDIKIDNVVLGLFGVGVI